MYLAQNNLCKCGLDILEDDYSNCEISAGGELMSPPEVVCLATICQKCNGQEDDYCDLSFESNHPSCRCGSPM